MIPDHGLTHITAPLLELSDPADCRVRNHGACADQVRFTLPEHWQAIPPENDRCTVPVAVVASLDEPVTVALGQKDPLVENESAKIRMDPVVPVTPNVPQPAASHE